jgi:hypothetical protein
LHLGEFSATVKLAKNTWNTGNAMGKPWEKDLQNCGKNHIYASLEEARN